MARLSSNFLNTYIPPANVEVPNYDRSQLKVGHVHIGPGNFPLAHIAAKTHALLQAGDTDALNYGIAVVGLNNEDRPDSLKVQNGLYTIVERDAAGENQMTVVGSIVDAYFAPDKPQAIYNLIAAPDTRIISLTVTPQTYESYMKDGHLNTAHPDIAHDLDPNNTPKTFLGYLARGLEARLDAVLPGVTIMNMDNMEHSGKVLHYLLSQFAASYYAEFGFGSDGLPSHINNACTFPNAMVDRIVPKTTSELQTFVSTNAGFIDKVTIPAEPMPQIGSWVVEDKFANGRPAWENGGHAIFVPDVLPYEKMKLRILNVSHSLMACLGDLAGMPFIHQTMQDATINKAIATLMDNETGPTLPEVPGIDLPAYKEEIRARFANPNVEDTTWRVAKDAPLKVVLDAARDQIEAGGSYELLALNTAAWMRRFRVETNEQGGAVDAVHPMADILKTKAKEGGNDPAAMFGIKEVFGNMGDHPEFVTAVAYYMDKLDREGVKVALQDAIDLSEQAANRTNRPAPRGGAAPSAAPAPGK